MSSADFLLVKPLKLDGAVPFSGGGGSFWDSAGVLQTAPPNTLRVTYDPSDLSKAPYALIEPESKNHLRNNTMAGAAAGVKPNHWGALDGESSALNGISATVLGVTNEGGIECLHLRYQGTATGTGVFGMYVRFDFNGTIPAQLDQKWAAGVFYRMRVMNGEHPTMRPYITERDAGGAALTIIPGPSFSTAGVPLEFYEMEHVTWHPQVAWVYSGIEIYFAPGKTYDFTFAIGLPQLCRDRVTKFPIKTSNGAVTRAADVIGPGAGLLYSSVPITEPLWAAGTYAKGAKVRDASNFVFESIADGNTAEVTDKTKWLPLGVTNRLKMFDKAVNSQTTAPDSLTVVVKAGQLANTLTLLNAAGSSVTVTQSESGYSRTISLVSHNVLSWYDFYYQEPQWTGDVTFGNIPPYINALLTVHVKSPGNQAALGGFFFGRAKFIGTTQWGLKAGILSYSGDEEDDFGNVTLLPRDSAKRMNFEVSIPRGYEDEAFRFLRAADNVEMVAIASTEWSMTQSYGYLGQWEVPLGIEGETMPVEWRGLI